MRLYFFPFFFECLSYAFSGVLRGAKIARRSGLLGGDGRAFVKLDRTEGRLLLSSDWATFCTEIHDCFRHRWDIALECSSIQQHYHFETLFFLCRVTIQANYRSHILLTYLSRFSIKIDSRLYPQWVRWISVLQTGTRSCRSPAGT